MSVHIPDHPEIRSIERTGLPSWLQDCEEEVEYCCECGKEFEEGEDTYECRTHRILCEECLKMLHLRYV
jgi:hypothetical protein